MAAVIFIDFPDQISYIYWCDPGFLPHPPLNFCPLVRLSVQIVLTLTIQCVGREFFGIGCRLNVRDQYGCTALYFAAKNGFFEVARCLVAAGADLNIADTKGWTPLSSTFERAGAL